MNRLIANHQAFTLESVVLEDMEYHVCDPTQRKADGFFTYVISRQGTSSTVMARVYFDLFRTKALETILAESDVSRVDVWRELAFFAELIRPVENTQLNEIYLRREGKDDFKLAFVGTPDSEKVIHER